MGLQAFERRLEQLVEGVFARASRGGLQPVELGRRMTREMDLERTVGVRGLVAPNHFLIELSPQDAERFEAFGDTLRQELAEGAREHARTEGYRFLGSVVVEMTAEPSLSSGVFRVGARTEAGAGGMTSSLLLPDGRRVTMGDQPLTIGRLPESAVVIDDPNVSRRHAELVRRDGAVILVDLGSTNGTLVNGVQVTESPLSDGDELTVGATALRYELI
ncbi:MAG TPA: DUF3662 and FHA domain-containing protein [Acidimicrobiales bacterium]|nr:DUF3662 and FHA domain-containing protein [Acidimicrobiales bacterium]